MKYTNASYEIWEQEPGIQGIFKQIERAGRICYKSEDNITEDSAEPFVQRMIDSKHTAMLEHGTVYLYVKHDEQDGVDMGDPYDISLNLILNRFTVLAIHPFCINSFINGSANSFACGCCFPVVPLALMSKKPSHCSTVPVITRGDFIAHGSTTLASSGFQPSFIRYL